MDTKTFIPTLSKREQECAMYLIQGMTCREIAATLFISRRTVETHMEHLKEKLSCQKKSQLIFKLLQSELG